MGAENSRELTTGAAFLMAEESESDWDSGIVLII